MRIQLKEGLIMNIYYFWKILLRGRINFIFNTKLSLWLSIWCPLLFYYVNIKWLSIMTFEFDKTVYYMQTIWHSEHIFLSRLQKYIWLFYVFYMDKPKKTLSVFTPAPSLLPLPFLLHLTPPLFLFLLYWT